MGAAHAAGRRWSASRSIDTREYLPIGTIRRHGLRPSYEPIRNADFERIFDLQFLACTGERFASAYKNSRTDPGNCADF